MIIGIDLGTTHSLVAYLDEDARPRLIPNALGETLTPSVVGVDPGGELLVGRAASELQVVDPERCAGVFKRHMGTDWRTKLDGRQFDAVELSSLVLGSLRRDAEAHLGQEITRAVITVPAYFNEAQRQATVSAGRMAGLTVERILNEPTAAAIAYGLQDAGNDSVALVFDLGGGTFDVSIVERFEGMLEIRASSGEVFLGGEDFTMALVSRVLEREGSVLERVELEAPRRVSRLRQECEVAKRRLAREESATIRVPNDEGGFDDDGPVVEVSRSEFAEWTERVLSRTDVPLRQALGDAGLKRSEVDEVILVGGATRMTAVRERIRETFEREPRIAINPDEVVALGAAVQAGLVGKDAGLGDFVVTDVAPFTLGIETSREIAGDRKPGYFLPIVHRNTTIPVSRVECVGTVAPNQTEIRVRIFQGESRRVDDNLFLGEFKVDGIPRGPAGQSVDVRFTYDLNGLLQVEATVVETKRTVEHLVTKYAQGLSEREIEQAVERMTALKTHPREESRNRYLIRWADRLYRELPMMLRKDLEPLLHGFEEALELRDESAIEANRAALETFLSANDASGHDTEGDDEQAEW